jgi:hypothetical protein
MGILIDKFDVSTIETLSADEFITYQKELLAWMQDINWPVAKVLSERLIPYVPQMTENILKILNGNDFDWKLNLISQLLYYCDDLPEPILVQLKMLKDSHTELSDIKDECAELLEKFGK